MKVTFHPHTAATVAFAQSDYTVPENTNTPLEVCVTLTSLPNGGLERNLILVLSTRDITAQRGVQAILLVVSSHETLCHLPLLSGIDYSAVGLVELTYEPGSAVNDTKCDNTWIHIQDDPDREGAERFTVDLSSSISLLRLGDPTSATVTITGDDGTLLALYCGVEVDSGVSPCVVLQIVDIIKEQYHLHLHFTVVWIFSKVVALSYVCSNQLMVI